MFTTIVINSAPISSTVTLILFTLDTLYMCPSHLMCDFPLRHIGVMVRISSNESAGPGSNPRSRQSAHSPHSCLSSLSGWSINGYLRNPRCHTCPVSQGIGFTPTIVSTGNGVKMSTEATFMFPTLPSPFHCPNSVHHSEG